MMMWKKINFMNSNSPLMEQMINFHDYLISLMLLITSMVLYYLMINMKKNFINKKFLIDHNMELMWTIIPMLILLMIVFPSMKILYLMEELNPMITLSSKAHQWYWSYNFPEFNTEFDSYMSFNKKKNLRLIETDNKLKLPMSSNIRILLSSEDVIHSWTIPSLAIKSDAIPGRINQLNFFLDKPGMYFGQCSEICGANHSFMPISLESVSKKTFLKQI